MTCECVAADYEKHSSPQQLWARDVCRTMKLTGDARVLDIGCFKPTPPVGIRCGSLGKTI